MQQHPYLRAYMAGIAAPTAFFLVLLGFVESFHPWREMEWALVFPLSMVPNGFGLWNMLYVKLHQRWHHAIGLHGAVLPFFFAPLGFLLATSQGWVLFTSHALVYFGEVYIPYWWFAFFPFVGITVYYLVWKYVVGRLNRVLDLPC